MVSLRNVRKLEKFISNVASSLKKHSRKNIGILLFASFLETIVMHKRVGMVIARQRAITVRRIRVSQVTESLVPSRLNTARLGTQNQFLVAKALEAT